MQITPFSRGLMFRALTAVTFLVLLTLTVHPAEGQKIDTSFLYRITNVAVGNQKALTLAQDGENNLAILRPVVDHPMQYWKLQEDKYGNYRLLNAHLGNGFSLEVINDANHNKVRLAENGKGAGQFWRVVSNRDGTYHITSLWQGPGFALDMVIDGSNNNELILKETASGPGQQWKLTRLPKTAVQNPQPAVAPVAAAVIDPQASYRLTTVWQGKDKSLGVVGGKLAPKLFPTETILNQNWKLQGSSGTYRIINQQHPDWSLDVVNDGQNNNIILSRTDNVSGQFWHVSSNPDGTYRITSRWQGDGKSLDVLNDGTNNIVYLNTTANYSGQQWVLTKTDLPPASVGSQEPSTTPPPAPSNPTTKDRLNPGEELVAGQKLVSPNGNYTLIQQEDGNLVIYNKADKPVWASGTNGKGVKKCVMQEDGNLVQYLAYHLAMWASGTDGNKGAYLILQDDGNLVIYSLENKALWATNTTGK